MLVCEGFRLSQCLLQVTSSLSRPPPAHAQNTPMAQQGTGGATLRRPRALCHCSAHCTASTRLPREVPQILLRKHPLEHVHAAVAEEEERGHLLQEARGLRVGERLCE